MIIYTVILDFVQCKLHQYFTLRVVSFLEPSRSLISITMNFETSKSNQVNRNLKLSSTLKSFNIGLISIVFWGKNLIFSIEVHLIVINSKMKFVLNIFLTKRTFFFVPVDFFVSTLFNVKFTITNSQHFPIRRL